MSLSSPCLNAKKNTENSACGSLKCASECCLYIFLSEEFDVYVNTGTFTGPVKYLDKI